MPRPSEPLSTDPTISRRLWNLVQQVPEGPGRPSRDQLLAAVREDLREVIARERRLESVVKKLREQLAARNACLLSGRLSSIEAQLARLLNATPHTYVPSEKNPAYCHVCQRPQKDH